jgi:hypothetical protein
VTGESGGNEKIYISVFMNEFSRNMINKAAIFMEPKISDNLIFRYNIKVFCSIYL